MSLKRLLFIFLATVLPSSSRAQLALFSGPIEPDFSIVQLGDLHAGGIGYVAANFDSLTATLLASNAAWNIKALISPGDLMEGEYTNTSYFAHWPTDWNNISNNLLTLKTAGIHVLLCQGNHDCDVYGATNGWQSWTNEFGGLYSDNWLVASRNNYQDVAWCFTNGPGQWLFIGQAWRLSPSKPGVTTGFSGIAELQTAWTEPLDWCQSVISSFPAARVVYFTHFGLNSSADLDTRDSRTSSRTPYTYGIEGPGIYAWQRLNGCKQWTLFLSGHCHGAPMANRVIPAGSGKAGAVFLNTQFLNGYYTANVCVVYFVHPSTGTIDVLTWDNHAREFVNDSREGLANPFTIGINNM